MKVNIIGAGISGLYAGYLLSESNIDCEIFEASNRSGGRIFSWPYNNYFAELGAEVVYAPDSFLIKTLKALGDPVHTFSGENYYLYKSHFLTQKITKEYSEIDNLMRDIAELENYIGDDKTLYEYFIKKDYYTEDIMNLVEAFACEYGTTARNLSIKNLASEERMWTGGNDEYYSCLPLQRVSDYYKNKISDKIQYKKIITNIDYSGNDVVITDDNREEYISDITIVSVNLGILKAGDINFFPDLPLDKQRAIQTIGIDEGMKVILIFSEKWWTEDLLTLEGGELCYEFLATKNYGLPTLTGFVMGEKAKAFQGLNNKQIGDLLTKEIDKIFGHEKASYTLTQVFSKNWGNDVYHKGAYSYPTMHSDGMREILSTPVAKKLYFMGEACNTNGHAATIHGAMETAEKVCQLISR